MTELTRLDAQFRQPAPLASRKMVYLESARGVAALIVVAFHHVQAFLLLPSQMAQPLELSPTMRTAHRALSIVLPSLFNGPFAVRFFFVLSGFVLSLSFLKTRRWALLRTAATKRYPRLAIPVLGTMLLTWVLLPSTPLGRVVAEFSGQTSQAWVITFLDHRTTLRAAIFDGLVGTFFVTTPPVNCSLWTMSIELISSFLVFGLVAVTAGRPRRRWLYPAAAAVLFALQYLYAVDFVVGVAIADWWSSRPANNLPEKPWLAAAMLIGAMPSAVLMSHLAARVPGCFNLFVQYSSLAAGAVLVSLLIWPALQRGLEIRPLAWLGKVSFGIYLIHIPVLASVGLRGYIASRHSGASHTLAALAAALSTLVVTLPLAALIH